MAYLIIDGCADTLWKSFIVQRCRDASHLCRHAIDNIIDFLCTHTGMDLLCHLIQAGNIDLGTLLDPRDLLRCLDDLMRWHDMSRSLKGRDLVIERLMTLFVLSSASTPAWIISSDFHFHHYPFHPDRLHNLLCRVLR